VAGINKSIKAGIRYVQQFLFGEDFVPVEVENGPGRCFLGASRRKTDAQKQERPQRLNY
jgi:hypothetical protein